MTDSLIKYIIERIIENAYDSLKDVKENPNAEYYEGHRIAHYEILDIIKNELEIHDEDLKEYGLDMNLEEVFL